MSRGARRGSRPFRRKAVTWSAPPDCRPLPVCWRRCWRTLATVRLISSSSAVGPTRQPSRQRPLASWMACSAAPRDATRASPETTPRGPGRSPEQPAKAPERRHGAGDPGTWFSGRTGRARAGRRGVPMPGLARHLSAAVVAGGQTRGAGGASEPPAAPRAASQAAAVGGAEETAAGANGEGGDGHARRRLNGAPCRREPRAERNPQVTRPALPTPPGNAPRAQEEDSPPPGKSLGSGLLGSRGDRIRTCDHLHPKHR
jgi:hypothetical protein